MKGILVATSPENVIGKDNTIPWHYSEDLKRFKRLTIGKTVIMGRKTWESLPVKPLPALPSIRVENFHINISPNNKEIEKELKKIGAFYKQKTYEFIF